MVGDQLGVKLWLNGMMNEIRRYPNEIPCFEKEIPSMILPFASGDEKVEWGFTAGMSCLSPGENGSVIIRNAEHFPACTVLALLSLLHDAGAADKKKITLTIQYADTPELKPFLDLLGEAEKKLPNVTIRRNGTLQKEERKPQQQRKIIPLGNSIFIVLELHQTDVGRFVAKVRGIDGSIHLKDDLTVTDGRWNVLQEHCPVTVISGTDQKSVADSDDVPGDDFYVAFAMWFPPNTPAFEGMILIRETQTPAFTPRPMPPAVSLLTEKATSSGSWIAKIKSLFHKPSAKDPQPQSESSGEKPPVKDKPVDTPAPKGTSSVSPQDVRLMLSQLVALYEHTGRTEYRARYYEELGKLGFSEQDAEKLLEVERTTIRRFNKGYLLSPAFTKTWFMGLQQPFFLNDPKTKPDILKERFFTISEICKFIDEAEWHFWNSHEKAVGDGVFEEISAWRLRGEGGDFAIKYCESISADTGISMDLFSKYINREGSHLSRYKW